MKDINLKMIKGRFIPGTDNKNYFIIISDDSYPKGFEASFPEEKKIYCNDCNKPVESYKSVLWINDERIENRTRVCDSCYKEKYAPIKRLHNVNTEMSNCV